MLKLRDVHYGGCVCGCPPSLQAEVRPFSTDPIEAIEFMRRKVNVPTRAWTDLWQEEHSAAFTVAGATTKALVGDFRDAIDKVIAQGKTLADFQKDFDRIVDEHGWSYNGSRNWRSRVIFDTNISTAYAAGKWEQIQRTKKQRPYLRYMHLAGQKNPRPEHEAWDGLILPIDDPWWDTHYPPNGWYCHCTVQTLSDDDLEREGYEVGEAPRSRMVEAIIRDAGGTPRTIRVPEGIDPGFAYRPGAMPAFFDDE